MSRIRILPDHVANQIAAGEVIERPVAVVKELVENSLDAGATRVEVDFRQGGKSLIRIEDNGSGMSADEALLALERHATSKLSSADDLNHIRTFGFRGEALPSVASVSRFTLRSKRTHDTEGTELLVNGGKILHQKACGMPQGTVIEVAHLFNSVPARRKFLKTDKTEAAHIVQCVRLFALAHPQVTFSLCEDGRQVFRSPPCLDLMERVGEVWSKSLVSDLIELPREEVAGIVLHGVIMRPGQGRSSRYDLQCFVNGRPVDSRTLNYAVLESYHTYLPRGRYPAAFLFLEIDPAAVDVNVHPAKREIRFRDEGEVRRVVVRAVIAALAGYSSGGQGETPFEEVVVPAEPVSGVDKKSQISSTDPTGLAALSDQSSSKINVGAPEKTLAARLYAEKYPTRTQAESVNLAEKRVVSGGILPSAEARRQQAEASALPLRFDWSYLGLLRKPRRFALFETRNGLVLMNCRAAHERVVYEQLCQAFAEENVVAQGLLMPLTLELDPVASAALEPHLEALSRLGLSIEAFGRNFYRITALPQVLDSETGVLWVKDLIEGLRDGSLTLSNHRLAHEKIALIASTRALRIDDTVSEYTLVQLAKNLLLCKQPLTCPRGHPTFLEWNSGELGRKFGLSY